MADAQAMPEQSWCNTDGATFETRIGPQYSVNKKKDSSKPCIYECVAVDLFATEAKIRYERCGTIAS